MNHPIRSSKAIVFSSSKFTVQYHCLDKKPYKFFQLPLKELTLITPYSSSNTACLTQTIMQVGIATMS